MLLLLCLTVARGQEDSTRYINGLPVTADDSVSEVPPADQWPYNKLTPVKSAALPAGVRHTLENNSQYQGWQDTTIYHDRQAGLYMVPLRDKDGIRIYGLNKNGDPVTFSEVAPRNKK